MNPGASPLRRFPSPPTTCRHASQATMVARPHPSRAIRLRPTRLTPPGPPSRHRTTPRTPKVMPLTRSTTPTTSEPSAATASRGTVPSQPGEREEEEWPKATTDTSASVTVHATAAPVRQPLVLPPKPNARIGKRMSATARCQGGGSAEPRCRSHERSPGRPCLAERCRPAARARLDRATHLHHCHVAPPLEIHGERGHPRPVALLQSSRRRPMHHHYAACRLTPAGPLRSATAPPRSASSAASQQARSGPHHTSSEEMKGPRRRQ